MRPEIRCTQVTTFGDKTYQVKGSFGHLDPFKKQGLPCLRTHVALADTAWIVRLLQLKISWTLNAQCMICSVFIYIYFQNLPYTLGKYTIHMFSLLLRHGSWLFPRRRNIGSWNMKPRRCNNWKLRFWVVRSGNLLALRISKDPPKISKTEGLAPV